MTSRVVITEADRYINMRGHEVRALLEGRKTQHRTVLRPQPTLASKTFVPRGIPIHANDFSWPTKCGHIVSCKPFPPEGYLRDFPLPYAPGDRLWVREAWTAQMDGGWTIADARRRMFNEKILYRADGEQSIDGWWPSVHMPREFSRLTLIVEAVKVERLQDISTVDAMAEGIGQTWGDWGGHPPECFVGENNRYGDASGTHIYDNHTSIKNFSILWNSTHGPGAWEANPWVVALTFRVVKGNIDQIGERG